MALRNIVTEGEPILRKTCREIGEVTERIKLLIDDMVETMRSAQGVGLAAPQVGVMRRVFVAEPEPERLYVFINPEIIYMEGEQESEEGCLSVPGYTGLVVRPERIKMKGLDREGNEREHEFEGFEAVIMCHEFDHLEGVLYIDKAKEMYKIQPEAEE